MPKKEVVVLTSQRVDVATAFGVSFVIAVGCISTAAMLNTFLIALIVTAL